MHQQIFASRSACDVLSVFRNWFPMQLLVTTFAAFDTINYDYSMSYYDMKWPYVC